MGEELKYSTPTLLHTITTSGSSIGAVTMLADSVFLVRRDAKQIEVYETTTTSTELMLKRHIKLPDIGTQVYGLVACPTTNSLYISDWDNECIHRVKLTDDTVTKWAVGNQPAGLSRTRANNAILVTCHGAGQLQEYTGEGELLRQIVLDEDIRLAWHAVQTPNGQFVISHEGPRHRVCLIDNSGHVLKSYGEIDEMQYPRSVVFTEDKTILVADQCNNRILVIDPSMATAEQLSITVEGGLQWPYGLHLDESSSCLYIGEWHSGRLLVLNNVKPIPVQ
jgi:DNA-binding beta-propeller fold protein YncE